MNKRDRERLKAAYEMEGDATIGAGVGFGKYTREVAERARTRGTKDDPRCGSQGVDEDGHCVRCGLRVDEEEPVDCPPGFLTTDEKIVAAAINYDGMIYSMPRPARHAHILNKMCDLALPPEFTELPYQGFLTSAGRFVDRQEGLCIARRAGQLVRGLHMKDTLTSEDVW